LPFTALAVSLILPGKLGGTKFIPIYETLTIRAQKNSPPHIAFEGLYEVPTKDDQWSTIEKKSAINLATHLPGEAIRSPAALLAKKVVLPEMVLVKTSEVLIAESEQYKDLRERSWVQELPAHQVQRLEEAQRHSDIANQDWRPPTLVEMAREKLQTSAVQEKPQSKIYVAAHTPDGETKTEVPRANIDLSGNEQTILASLNAASPTNSETAGGSSNLNSLRVVGPLEITGGLAVTNEHHFEVRRNDRGVYKELGKVDLMQGLYNIDVDDISGTVVARLVNKEGKILGEGSFRLGLATERRNNVVVGPKIKIAPHTDYSGSIASLYNAKAEDAAPSMTKVSFVQGASEMAVKKDGVFAMDNVVKRSSTVLRASAPNHMQTSAIIISGQEFKAQVFPTKMISALQNIVFDQRSSSVSSTDNSQIIWGKVALDGKPVAGIEVFNENDPELTPVYFNSFMIPDPQLKTTSDNGLFAFVGANQGFQSIVATRAGAIFGYQNVVVEMATVAQADIESTIRKEAVAVSVYDAFTGEPSSAALDLQSLEEKTEVVGGAITLMLPPISRLGILRAQPEINEYVAAKYIYSDSDSYIHVPLVRWSWLNAVKSYLRLDDQNSVGTLVGFVPDEDFEVYLAGHDDFDRKNIVYFDMQGRILQTGKGASGGGFIIYNTPAGTQEVVVLGEKSKKMYSKVVPVEEASLAVLSFQE
jgi:hypothetical protein